MSNEANDFLWTARWHIAHAIKTEEYGPNLAAARDLIDKAEASLVFEEDEPERPSEAPEIKYTIPTIVKVAGVRAKIQGKYKTSSKKCSGLVVHYTVSGSSKANAKGVLSYMCKKGLGCPVMDENGVIFIPENMDIMSDYAYHAGTSRWNGQSGMSRYFMGIEICSWGKLNKKTELKAKDMRHVKAEANIKAGTYEPYTKAQEESLKNLILWMLDVNPEFKVDNIVGHDEIAPERKSDPGGSLSLSMPKYRDQFRQNES